MNSKFSVKSSLKTQVESNKRENIEPVSIHAHVRMHKNTCTHICAHKHTCMYIPCTCIHIHQRISYVICSNMQLSDGHVPSMHYILYLSLSTQTIGNTQQLVSLYCWYEFNLGFIKSANNKHSITYNIVSKTEFFSRIK